MRSLKQKKKPRKGKPKLENTAKEFAEMMIKKIQEVSDNWTTPWFTVKHKNFIPQNLEGRTYRGGNVIMLLFLMMFTRYRLPVFVTFKHAQQMGFKVLKGERGFYVYHFSYMYRERKKGAESAITEKQYNELPYSEKDNYIKIPIPRQWKVFNLDQTNFAEAFPEKWKVLTQKFEEDLERNSDPDNMYSNALLDDVIFNNKWDCPIDVIISDSAYYMPSKDKIVVPEKKQFHNGEAFYSTTLHEISHSTGAEKRLNREGITGERTQESYAKEELIAELSSALMGYYLGVSTTIREENAQYLKGWLGRLKADENFIMDVLLDSTKSVDFISKHIGFKIPGDAEREPKKRVKGNIKKPVAAELQVVEE